MDRRTSLARNLRLGYGALALAASSILFGLFATISLAQTSSTVRKNDNSDANACERQFREMEIGAGSPHQSGAMKEFCQNIAASCGAEGSDADCLRAKRDLPAALSQARKFREQHK